MWPSKVHALIASVHNTQSTHVNHIPAIQLHIFFKNIQSNCERVNLLLGRAVAHTLLATSTNFGTFVLRRLYTHPIQFISFRVENWCSLLPRGSLHSRTRRELFSFRHCFALLAMSTPEIRRILVLKLEFACRTA